MISAVHSKFAKLALALLVLAPLANANAGSTAATMVLLGTYSASATETTLQFDGRVGLRSSSAPNQSAAQRQIRKQIKFLQSNFRRLKIASVRSDWNATVTQIETVSSGLYRISYRFSATAIITNQLLNNIEVLLPVNPDTVETDLRIQTCEDEHMGHGAFYYYWNPRLQNCSMVEGSDYIRLVGYFNRTPNTYQTYPEYNRLFASGVARVSVFLGKVNTTDGDDPVKGNPWAFPTIQNGLKQMGFVSRITSYSPYIEEFAITTPRGPVLVMVFFGESAIAESSSRTFHQLYKSALENSGVVFYGGHAGTGKNLNLSMIKEASGLTLQPNRNLYQIYMFGACYPYAYYVKDYFDTKVSSYDPRGTKNLDIISEGIEGDFAHSGPQVVNTVKAIVDYATGARITSYQELLSSDYAFSKALMSVSGDEDNPTSPQQVQ